MKLSGFLFNIVFNLLVLTKNIVNIEQYLGSFLVFKKLYDFFFTDNEPVFEILKKQ